MPVDTVFQSLRQDVRYAFRGLARNPMFTATAILAAALGIGSTTAVFSVVDRILFRSLPYPDEDRLVSVGMLAPIDSNEFLFPDAYFDLRRNQTPFESITSFTAGVAGCDLSEANPVRLGCAQVEGNFIAALGLAPFLGRNFTAAEDRRGAPKVALMSYALWQSRYGRDPGVAGKVLSIDGGPVTIVGVLPRNFELPTLAQADLVLPEALNEATEHNGRALRVFAKLKPGVSIAQARAALEPSFQRILSTVPAAFRREISLRVRSLRDRQVQDARMASWVLLGSVVAVLLIACANIANLLLARSTGRRKELAVRAALGASRARLVRQALTESVLLAILGGAAGCGFAWTLLRLFVGIAPQGIPRLEQASLDVRALVFAAAGAMIAGLLFGLAPAFQSPGVEALTGSRSTGERRTWLRESLVAVQIAVSVVLLAGAGMLLRSLWKLESVPLGLGSEHVVTVEFSLGKLRYSQGARQLRFFEDVEARIRRIPGAASVAISDSIPPSGGIRGRPLAAIRVEGRPPMTEGTGGMVVWRYVTPDYFQTLGIPIVRGRSFVEQDRAPGDEAVVLNEALARRLFPAGDAVGKRFYAGVWHNVVGVARDVKNSGATEPASPEYEVVRKHSLEGIFQNQMAPDGWRHGLVVIRTRLNHRAVSDWIRREFAAIDPEVPFAVGTLEQRVDKLAQRPRFNAFLLAIFAGMGMVLAAVGLYGVMAFLVGQRTQEIGVRMAFGATPAAIAKLVLSRAAAWALAGAAVGIGGAWLAARAIRSLLYQVPEHDPGSLAAAVLGLLLIALAAAWSPARRAARVDPLTALRHE